jgi:hypothetical protein
MIASEDDLARIELFGFAHRLDNHWQK